MLFIHETFLVYKMETLKNCKEVKHIMIMIIDYDFLSYVILYQQLKISFRKSSAPPPLKKFKSPFYSLPPKKIQKVQVPPFLLTLKIFQAPLQKGGRILCHTTKTIYESIADSKSFIDKTFLLNLKETATKQYQN